jgi:predicted dehydrogenase
VRFAVVGLGHIAQMAILPAFAHARKLCTLSALISDEERKLRALGRRYGVKERVGYHQYDDLLRSGAIDAVYIALPNDLHREFAVRAARAGVHVLCEKPLALDEEGCIEMIDAADRAGVKLMTAYRLHFERANMEAVELLRARRIGTPRYFHSLFGLQVRDAGNIRLQAERGGGPLFDLGVYCINAARYLFRAEPEEVLAMHGNNGEARFSEVPEMTAGLLRFPEDRLASFTCSFGSADVSTYRVVGTDGDLEVEPAFDYATGLAHRFTVEGRTRRRKYPKRDQFAPELLHFAECILEDREPEPSGREGLADVRVIRALLASAATGKAVRLSPFTKEKRPSLAIEHRTPAVSKPEVVGEVSGED